MGGLPDHKASAAAFVMSETRSRPLASEILLISALKAVLVTCDEALAARSDNFSSNAVSFWLAVSCLMSWSSSSCVFGWGKAGGRRAWR